MATPVAQLLTELTRHSEPRLTWYGVGGERIELSGRVLANWAIKSANLLTEECGIDAGESIRLDMPIHWRTLVIALAAWTAGATVVTDCGADAPSTATRPDLIATDRPTPQLGPTLAISLAALATGFEGELHGATDYAAEVLGFADVLGPMPTPEPGQAALLLKNAPPTPYSSLTADAAQMARESGLASADAAAAGPGPLATPGRRVLLRGEGWQVPGAPEMLLVPLGILSTGGSIVLAAPGIDGVHHFATAERCSAVWPRTRATSSPGAAIV